MLRSYALFGHCDKDCTVSARFGNKFLLYYFLRTCTNTRREKPHTHRNNATQSPATQCPISTGDKHAYTRRPPSSTSNSQSPSSQFIRRAVNTAPDGRQERFALPTTWVSARNSTHPHLQQELMQIILLMQRNSIDGTFIAPPS